jgi:hypothetical protein
MSHQLITKDFSREEILDRAHPNMTVEQLAEYIRQHDTPARVDEKGQLWALHRFTQEGAAHREWEQLQPNLHAVRMWLGY